MQIRFVEKKRRRGDSSVLKRYKIMNIVERESKKKEMKFAEKRRGELRSNKPLAFFGEIAQNDAPLIVIYCHKLVPESECRSPEWYETGFVRFNALNQYLEYSTTVEVIPCSRDSFFL